MANRLGWRRCHAHGEHGELLARRFAVPALKLNPEVFPQTRGQAIDGSTRERVRAVQGHADVGAVGHPFQVLVAHDRSSVAEAG
ncbi:hypothetical protein [Rhizobium sp. 9140]|uniref:hypothetical protein n=1 Tax=Rhizobium sp. 9140 TaxID=1761900 RepID=UPI000792BA03|nr:hypothetical protein [Rhizobium sp. 9140]CZT36252.1 hypothetical protein GA0004734_00032520 [Rhizobium sp. 9140]